MSKCLDDELYDIYIEDGKQVIESLREIYEKGRADAFEECIEAIKHCHTCEIIMRLEQLKEQNK